MNSILPFLNFTVECQSDFEDYKLPTLDFKLWVGKDNEVLYTYFEKPTSSNQVIHRESAIPENTKMSTLNNEMVRMMLNTSEQAPME